MSYSKGIFWLDDCRIPFVDEVRTIPVHSEDKKTDETLFGLHPTIQHKREITTQGRFTPNLLVCDDMLNDGVISKSVKSKRGGVVDSNSGTYSWNIGKTEKVENYMCGVDDKGTNSRYYDLDLWFDKMVEAL